MEIDTSENDPCTSGAVKDFSIHEINKQDTIKSDVCSDIISDTDDNNNASRKVISLKKNVALSSLNCMTESLTKLSIDKTDEKKCEPKQPAGKINNVLRGLSLVIVQALPTRILCCPGTPLFLPAAHSNSEDYILVGEVDDIFGPVGEPMYSVRMENNSTNFLNIGDRVYYSPDNPKTQLMHTGYLLKGTFDILKYNTKKKNKPVKKKSVAKPDGNQSRLFPPDYQRDKCKIGCLSLSSGRGIEIINIVVNTELLPEFLNHLIDLRPSITFDIKNITFRASSNLNISEHSKPESSNYQRQCYLGHRLSLSLPYITLFSRNASDIYM